MVRVAIDNAAPVDPDDVFLFHKTTPRRATTRRAARRHGADDVVLENRRGEVTESTIANVAVLARRPLGDAAPGRRAAAGDRAGGALDEGALVEGSITVTALREADGVALVSDNRGVAARGPSSD